MEREGLSLDRHLVHVLVAAIDVEITTAQTGKLELSGLISRVE
jgi:hypothetical protein